MVSVRPGSRGQIRARQAIEPAGYHRHRRLGAPTFREVSTEFDTPSALQRCGSCTPRAAAAAGRRVLTIANQGAGGLDDHRRPITALAVQGLKTHVSIPEHRIGYRPAAHPASYEMLIGEVSLHGATGAATASASRRSIWPAREIGGGEHVGAREAITPWRRFELRLRFRHCPPAADNALVAAPGDRSMRVRVGVSQLMRNISTSTTRGHHRDRYHVHDGRTKLADQADEVVSISEASVADDSTQRQRFQRRQHDNGITIPVRAAMRSYLDDDRQKGRR